MNFLILLYNNTLDWLECHEKQVLGFGMGVMAFTVFLMILNAHWVAAAIFAGLTYLNFYLNGRK
jgi:hypothetical protein